MTATIHLIRHGMTLANLEDRFAGRSNEPLHAGGVRQIHEVGSKLMDIGLSAIYSGPLPRTVQSAKIVAALCGVSLAVDDGLTDICLPHWDGLTKQQIRQRFGSEYPTWLSSPESFRVEGCETLVDVQRRAAEAVERIRLRENGQVLLVTHLIVARCLLLHYSNRPLAHFRSVKVANGDVVRLC